MDDHLLEHASDADFLRQDSEGSEPHSSPGGLPAVVTSSDEYDAYDDEEAASGDRAPGVRTWRHELPRWLATLDSTRTRREYDKAVRYFFQAPGVPEALRDLTFDLLLAYRGSLALRASGRHSQPGAPVGDPSPHQIMPPPGLAGMLAGGPRDEDAGAEHPPHAADDDAGAAGNAQRSTPLAPATVNIRLTALRQFLAHCSLWNLLPQLAPERVRAALRRLSIERRRPYQILAEPEWTAFLAAARGPHTEPRSGYVSGMSGGGDHTSETSDSHIERTYGEDSEPSSTPPDLDQDAELDRETGLWGVPRAVRLRTATTAAPHDDDVSAGREQESPHAADVGARRRPPSGKTPARVRSRAGLTGEHTAQRDHALLALALATGLRAIELCGLDVGDVKREWHAGHVEWWLVLPDAKTKGQRGGRTLPLAPALVATLLDYVRASDRRWEDATDRATPLFLSRRRARARDGRAEPAAQRLSPEQVRRIVDRVEAQWLASGAGSADGRAISPHALRHSTAVALLEGNDQRGRAPASVEHVRGWLGHFDIRTTQGYLAHLDARRHRRPFALQPVEEAPVTVDRGQDDNAMTSDDTPARGTD